jgi:hypothetical protein
MDIAQLQVTFDAEQDRLLLRINTTAGTELRLWLTRRLVRGFWPVWHRAVAHSRGLALPAAATPAAREALVEMERSQVTSTSDFATPFKTAETPQQLPLGNEPLLVNEVRLTPLPNGTLRSEWLRGSKLVGLDLGSNLMHALTKLVEDGVAAADWDLASPDESVALAEPVVKH